MPLTVEIKRLTKHAKRKGIARATLGLHYRATLYARPWRLMVVPMPPQPEDGGSALDPTGNPWDMGAQITASMIASRLGGGRWERVASPAVPDPRLTYVYEWRTD